MKRRCHTLVAVRRLLARRRPDGGMMTVGHDTVVAGVRVDAQWPALPHPVCYPGGGVELSWYGDGSYPAVDAAAVDRMIALHGPRATLRDAIPWIVDWRVVTVPVVGRAALPAWAELPDSEIGLLAEADRAVRVVRDDAHHYDLSPHIQVERAAHRWVRWWDVPRQRARALRDIQRALRETLDRATDRREYGRVDPKMTDALARCVVMIGGALHGGSGNSGECDHVAETKSYDDRHAGLDAYPQDACARERAEGGADQTPAAGDTACSRPGSAESEPAAQRGAGEGDRGANTPIAARDSAPDRTAHAERAEGAAEADPGAGDHPGRDARVSVQTGTPTDGDVGDIGRQQDDGGTAGRNAEPAQAGVDSASSPGGVCADASAARRRASCLLSPARDVVRALERLVAREVGVMGDPSPRLDAGMLVRELVSMSCRLSRARRDEMEMGRVVVAPDLSGSCSACAPDTLAAAYAMRDAMPQTFAVIEHSNGQWYDEAAGWRDLDTHPAIADGRCRCLLVFGDWDGGLVYRRIADRHPQCRIIWLDSWGKAGGVRPSADARNGRFRGWRSMPTKYDGVGTAADAAIALRHVMRGT